MDVLKTFPSGTHGLFNVRETTTRTVMVDLVSMNEFFKEKKRTLI